MKKGLKTSIMAAFLALASIFMMPAVNAQGYGEVSLDLFYDELSPYGAWDNDPSYGDIWFPNVSRDFRPYNTNGYWAMTEYGNTWVSNYDWGWAPFHYGRWVYTSYRGWGWIPGYEWGPAWVDWRSGNGYYGWAPMMPRVGIHVSVGLPINLWIFAPSRNIYAHDIYRYSHIGRRNIYNRTTIINNTYVVNNHHYYGGPSRRDMERTIGRSIAVRSVRQATRPGASRTDRRNVSIYRPDRDQSRSASRRTASASREIRGNDRSVSNRTSRNTSSRTDIRRSTDENRIGSNSRSTGNSGRREMYIDKKGQATIRESSSNRTSSSRTSREMMTGQRATSRQSEQRSQTQRNGQLDTRVRSNSTYTERNSSRSSAPQVERQQRSSERRSTSGSSVPRVERQQRSQQRTQPSTERVSNTPVQQVSTRSSGSNVSRQTSPRIERAQSTSRTSSARVSSSRSGRSSERR